MPMTLLAVYVASLVAFLAIDAIGLKLLLYPLFARHVGPILRSQMRFGVAAGFYLIYVAGVLYFAVLPGVRAESLGLAALNGAALGLIAYGTYETTNMATIEGWAWPMVVTDVAWGMALTAATATIGYAAARALI
jgi:uncharacterized membrane protein